jgi:hypothetical protein
VLIAEGHRRVEEGRQTRQEWLAGELQDKCTEEERRAVIGPLLVGLGGWRATLALNVPPAVAAVLLGLLRLPKENGRGSPRSVAASPPGWTYPAWRCSR